MKKYKFKSLLFMTQIVLLISILILVNGVGFIMFSKEFSENQDRYIEDGIESLEKQKKEYTSDALFISKINSVNSKLVDYLTYKAMENSDKTKLSELYLGMQNQINHNFKLIKYDYPYIADIEIIDTNGLVMYRTERNEYGDLRDDVLTIKALEGNESMGVNKSDEVDKIVLEGNYPVYSRGVVIGIVKTKIYLDDMLFNIIKANVKFDIGIIYNKNMMYFSNGDLDIDNLIVKTELGKSQINEKIYDDIINKGSIFIDKVSFWGDERYLTILNPLKSYDGKAVGVFIISYDLANQKLANMSIVKTMSMMMIIVALIAIILGYIATGYLTKSVIYLKNNIRDADENDENVEIEVDTKIEEVNDLSIEFNRMIKRVIGHKIENEYLEIVSNKDSLTGFWNHKFFYEKLADYMIEGIPFALLFLDIDKFKNINDSLGHKVGDMVLVELSKVLSEDYPQFEYFRYGGEEFAIVMEKTMVLDAYKIAENIRNQVEASESIKKITQGLSVTISIGITTSESGKLNLDEIISNADKAMYFGKYNGRNQSNIYDNEVEIFFETQEGDIIKRESIHTAVESLISTLEEKDYYSSSHSKFVEKFSFMLGKRIGLSLNSLDNLKMAASLHDIGKIGVPDSILKSNNLLNKNEYEIAKEHATVGFNIAKHLFKDEEILKGIRNHHERWDGKGYPDKLKAEKIPLFARIIAIADTYHSMVYGSHYRVKKTKEEAIEDLVVNSGSQFDPSLVDIFVDIVNDNYIYNGVECDVEKIINSSEREVSSAALGTYDIYDSTNYIMEVDKDYNIIFVNKAIADRLNMNADDLIGKKCYKSIYGNMTTCSNCKMPEVIYEKSVKESTKMDRRKNGDLVKLNQFFMPLFDDKGNVDHIMEFAYNREPKDPKKKV